MGQQRGREAGGGGGLSGARAVTAPCTELRAALPVGELEDGKQPCALQTVRPVVISDDRLAASQPPISTPCAAAGPAVTEMASRARVARAFVVVRMGHLGWRLGLQQHWERASASRSTGAVASP
jgi:hypothetical protein